MSSEDPGQSLNLGKDIATGIRMAGADFEWVSQYKIPHPDPGFSYIFPFTKKEYLATKRPAYKNFLMALPYVGKWLEKTVVGFKNRNRPKYRILHWNDYEPDISPKEWINAAPDKHYDLVITLFWTGSITPVTLKALYEKYRCPILIITPDMHPLTGGCFYPLDCSGYYDECRNCPAATLDYQKILPHNNVILKKRIYREFPIYIGGNSAMIKDFTENGMFQKSRCVNIGCVTNEDLFTPFGRENNRAEANFDEDEFVMLFGAQNIHEKRKGVDVLMKALEYYSVCLSKRKVTLLVAGQTNGMSFDIKGLKVKKLGFLGASELAAAYRMADVLLSPSLADAGPSMINQALMSGTPVVSFDIGVAQEIVIPGKTGFKAKFNDPEDFARCISLIENMEDKESIRRNCRNLAMQKFSRQVIGQKIMEFCDLHVPGGV